MRKTFAALLVLASAASAGAWTRGAEDMMRAASDELCLRLGPGVKVEKLMEREMLEVYGREQGGFVVVSRSASSAPVIGYSDSRFDEVSMPDALRWWLDEADRTLSARENILMPANSQVSPVAPLLSTAWGQDSPFNTLCPSTGGFWGTSVQTGCVATAMAQVMKYFNYPPASKGTGYYSTDGETLKETKLSTVYAWDKMLNRYLLNYSDEQASAVAELMRDCGYASRMVYTPQGSGTNLYYAAQGMALNMGYDSLAMKVMTRAYYRDSEWLAAIHDELGARRPILYTGVDAARMGHSFVLDGQNEQGFVHVNWGWTGAADGYFDMSVLSGLNPSYMDPYTGTEIKYDFRDEHIMVLGFRPDSTPAEGERYESRFVGIEIPDVLFQDDSFLISTTPIFNFSHLDFTGLLGLVIEGEDGHAVVQPFFYSGWEDGATIPVIGGVYYPEEYYPFATLNDTDGKTERPDGKYRFYFVSWADQEMAEGSEPRMIRYPMAMAPEGGENYAVWEAEKKNGHWDESSLHLVDVSTGVTSVAVDTEADVPDGIYTLDGVRLESEGCDFSKLASGRPVIVRSEGKTYKIMPR